jgi:hypothetical protein
MGSPTRAHNNHYLRPQKREIHLLHLPQHSPIGLRSPKRTRIPLRRNLTPSQARATSSYISNESNSASTPPCLHYQFFSLTIRLCLPKTHRLHNLHPRQIMQTPTRHVPPHNNFPQEVSPI